MFINFVFIKASTEFLLHISFHTSHPTYSINFSKKCKDICDQEINYSNLLLYYNKNCVKRI